MIYLRCSSKETWDLGQQTYRIFSQFNMAYRKELIFGTSSHILTGVEEICRHWVASHSLLFLVSSILHFESGKNCIAYCRIDGWASGFWQVQVFVERCRLEGNQRLKKDAWKPERAHEPGQFIGKVKRKGPVETCPSTSILLSDKID